MPPHLGGHTEPHCSGIGGARSIGRKMFCAQGVFSPWAIRFLAVWALAGGFLGAGADAVWAGLPRIDPSGERIFLPPERTEPDGRLFEWNENAALYLHPREVVAPIGSEVILVATVVGPDGYTTTNERVEWSIAAGGVGEFVQVGKGSWLNWLVLDFTRARKLCTTFAITSTLRRPVRLTRGTADMQDDVLVQPGQAWVSVSSPTEGVSYVSAFAPSVAPWGQRRQTARIHWVDAQWTFPAPSIQPAGSRHTLTTTVLGRSDGRPRRGWLVRYEILDGPTAGFAPDGARVVEVATNEAGQASVELFQAQPSPGSNRIQIQILRPSAGGGPESARLVLASGMTTCTWSAPQLAVRVIGPSVASVGSSVRYTLEVSNPGDLLAEGVRLAVQLPEGATFVGSTPPGQLTGLLLQWEVGTLGPGQVQRGEVILRADRAGGWNICAEAVSPRGLRARQCASTTISPVSATSPTATSSPAGAGPSTSLGTPSGVQRPIELRISAPSQAALGQQVQFDILVINRTPGPISGLVIRNRFGPGFRHEMAPTGVMERSLPELPAGGQQQFYLTLQVVQTGQVCHTVELYQGATLLESRQVCLNAVAGGPSGPVSLPGPSTSSQGSAPSSGNQTGGRSIAQPNAAGMTPEASLPLKVRSWTEPAKAIVGQEVLLILEIQNTSATPIPQLQVRVRHDPQLLPRRASQGARLRDQNVEWLIDALPPDQRLTLQVQYFCDQPGPKVCMSTQVTSGHAQANAESCLTIEPAASTAPPGSTGVLRPPELVVTVTDLKDPAVQGDTVPYVITVQNQGQQPDFQVAVTVALSSHLMDAKIGTSGPARYEAQGQQLRFRPVEQIRPGETLTYRIMALARSPGEAELSVTVQSQSLSTPKTATQKTRINPKRG